MPKRRAKGEGTIYQRADGRWSGQITLPNGKRRTKYGKTQGEVRDWLTAQRGAINTGGWSANGNVRLGEFLTTYLRDVVTDQVRKGTLNNYVRNSNTHIIPALGKMRLSSLRPEHLQQFYAEKVAGGMAPGTVLILHNIIRQALQQAEQWDIVPRNIATFVHPPRRQAPAPTILSIEQLNSILTYTRTSKQLGWLGVVIHLAVATGLRRGELLGLHWPDIDLDQSSLRVSRIATRLMSDPVVATAPKTKSSFRVITLDTATVELLRKYKSTSWGEIVFPSSEGSYRDGDILYGIWQRVLKAVGVPHVKFHALRHLHATMLLEQNINPKVVSERLGHASIGITLQTYSHVSTRLEHGAADAIGQAMQGIQHE